MAMVKTPRRSMTPARRKRIFLAHGGVCGFCHEKIAAGEPFEIDHEVPLALGGSDNDGNCYPIHVRCHEIKTFGLKRPGRQRVSDFSAIAKVKRLRAKRLGLAPQKPSRLRDPYFKRKVDGTVVPRSGISPSTTGETR